MKRIIKSINDWNNKRKLIREVDILIDRCTNGKDGTHNICANIRSKIFLIVRNKTCIKKVSTDYVIMQICRRFRFEDHMTVNGLPFYNHTFDMLYFGSAYWWIEKSHYSDNRIIFLEVLKEFIKERSFDDIIYYITDPEGWKKKK